MMTVMVTVIVIEVVTVRVQVIIRAMVMVTSHGDIFRGVTVRTIVMAIGKYSSSGICSSMIAMVMAIMMVILLTVVLAMRQQYQ